MDVKGQYNTARIFADNIEEEAIGQIITLCNQAIFKEKRVRIMPDVHAGKGCVIGFTAELSDQVIPNLIGVDIGCGMLSTNLGPQRIDFEKLDHFIRNSIPHGFKKHTNAKARNFPKSLIKQLNQTCNDLKLEYGDHLRSIGTLGGGNHFIEINKDRNGNHWLVIHSGSRNFGLKVATTHQQKAVKYCQSQGLKLPKDLSFLEGSDKAVYFEHMQVAQHFASLNRATMTERILQFLNMRDAHDQFETIHNYINFNDNIIRKGAISSNYGEKVLIPLNMRDGSIIAIGKGNSDWNNSAPHGAGRLYSRHKAKAIIPLDDFQSSMQEVWTSSVSKHTLDEAPQAYKPAEAILEQIDETVEVIDIMRPVYNFKG